MKGLIKLNVVLIALLFTTTIGATNYSTDTDDKKNTNVFFKDVKKGTVLTIIDANGLVLYKEIITKNGDYSKGFDLTALPNGLYYFELNKSIEISTIPFSVHNNKVLFSKDKKEVIFKPVVFINDKKVHISQTSLVDDTELKVKIYFEGDTLVYNDVIIKEGVALGKIYDFSTSRKGTYTVVMFTHGKRFVEQIHM